MAKHNFSFNSLEEAKDIDFNKKSARDKNRLGRGLDTLLRTSPPTSGSTTITEIDIDLIKPNPNQPRTNFDQEALEELSASIKANGIIVPITLKKNDDNTYQIIAGERRYRASQLAGLRRMPAYVKTAKDENILEMALIENIQREDLNAIEIALTYQRLLVDYQLTQEDLSDRVGKKRATIANYIRLLKLPAEIQLGLQEKKIETGHAKALVSLNDTQQQLALYKEVVERNYSVRDTEKRIRNLQNPTPETPVVATTPYDITPYQNVLTQHWGKRAQLQCNERGKGKLTISFASEQELQALLDSLNIAQ